MYKILALSAHKNIDKICEFLSPDIELVRGTFKEIEFYIGKKLVITHSGIPLENFDFIWLNSTWLTRDFAFAVMRYLVRKNIPHTKVEKTTSKLTDAVICNINNVNMPKTFLAHSCQIMSKPDEMFAKAKDYLKLPFIAKPIKGSLGTNTFLIDSRKDFDNLLLKIKRNKQFLIQEFIPNTYDWGINVANGKVVAASMRSRSSGFLNNIAQNAKETFVPINDVPEIVKECASQSAKTLNLNWIRADIIYNENTKKPFLLEVNRRPGMTEDSPEVKAFANFLDGEIQKVKEEKIS